MAEAASPQVLLGSNPWTFTRCLTPPCAYTHSPHAYCPGVARPLLQPGRCVLALRACCTQRYSQTHIRQLSSLGAQVHQLSSGRSFFLEIAFPKAQENLTFKVNLFSIPSLPSSLRSFLPPFLLPNLSLSDFLFSSPFHPSSFCFTAKPVSPPPPCLSPAHPFPLSTPRSTL